MVSHPSPVRETGSTAEAPDGSGTTALPENGRRSRTDDRREPAADGAHACPLCGFSDERRAEVYKHLQVSHRKSAISAALLESRSTLVE